MDSKLENAWRHHPRSFASNFHVYPVLSRRAGGVSLGVNLNLDKLCNFDCPYCQVDRTATPIAQQIDIDRIAAELWSLMELGRAGGFPSLPAFAGIAPEHLILRDIALSGDGEPTLVPEFADVCAALASLQEQCPSPTPRLVLITNATLLHLPKVQQGLQSLTQSDGEIWGKLDAGTEAWFQRISVARHSLDHIEENLARTGEQFPLRIQTMLCALDGEAPSAAELDAWAQRLHRIAQRSGANLREVQLYSLARRTAVLNCSSAPPELLEEARQRVENLGIYCHIYA